MISRLSDRTYGDGEYVVQFANVDSMWAPLKASVVGGKLAGFAEITFGPAERKPTCGLAAQAIEAVRKAVSS